MVRKVGEKPNIRKRYDSLRRTVKGFLPQPSMVPAFDTGIISGKPQITCVQADTLGFGGSGGGKPEKSDGRSVSPVLKELLEMPHEDIAWQYYYDHFEEHPDVTKKLMALGFENPFILNDIGLISYAEDMKRHLTNEKLKFLSSISHVMNMTFMAMRGISVSGTEGKFQEIKHCYMLAALLRGVGIRSGIIFKKDGKNIPLALSGPLASVRISVWARVENELYELNFRELSPLKLYIGAMLNIPFNFQFLPMLSSSDTKHNTVRQLFSFYSLAKGHSLDEAFANEHSQDEQPSTCDEAELEFVRACEIDPYSNSTLVNLESFVGELFHLKCLHRFETYEKYFQGKMNEYEINTFNKLLAEHKSVQYLLELNRNQKR